MNFRYCLIPIICCLAACNTTKNISSQAHSPSVPAQWSISELPVTKKNWLQNITTPSLNKKIQTALQKNHQIQQQYLAVQMAEQDVLIAGAALWPSLDGDLSASRRGRESGVDNSFGVDLKVSYEVDLWQKQSEAHRQANLQLMNKKSVLKSRQDKLVADVINAYYQTIKEQQLKHLYQLQVEYTHQQVDIIESGYSAGLNDALDVYLARNTLSNERAKLAAQNQTLTEQVRKLQRLQGVYPTGINEITDELPTDLPSPPIVMPLDVLKRKPEIQASWQQLLIKDAALAIAHKQRFPRLTLSASIGQSNEILSDVLSSSSLAWSLVSGLALPIFDAGRLAALEDKARLSLQQAEQQYLDTLYNALSQVENTLSKTQTLQNRYQQTLIAKQNAELAQALAFEKYQKGLIEYTTVLDAQQRAINANSSEIQLRYTMIENHIAVFVALGGDFVAGLTPLFEVE
ncbi:efflux transporter outer membrane subunit [Algibacillus agarilyticus]|uniref:efflux transporter outer membrane subunit n=1 Tax=Algibacillus agarilyticus TaxID=2234133 RepID=UPI000DD04728|nr:TolC family protein [Algibacillus agarilyticus]